MRKHDILYKWALTEIERLTDSDIAEEFAEQLNTTDSEKFVALTERIRNFMPELSEAKANRTHFPRWDELRTLVKSFGESFSAFPDLSILKLRLSLILAQKAYEASSMDSPEDASSLEENVEEGIFQVLEVTPRLPVHWFYRKNNQSIDNSVAIFSCDQYSDVEQLIESDPISPDLIYHFIAAIQHSDMPSSQGIIIKRNSSHYSSTSVNALARLTVLASGEAVHEEPKYNKPLAILNKDDIQPGVAYQQWSEVLHVLSEYNSRDEILSKYLTIYHVIENFMFKKPIVEVERQQDGSMFSIRDFRRLYSGVDMKELNALKKVFREVFEMNAVNQTNFRDHLRSKWQALTSETTEQEIEKALTTLNLNPSFNDFVNNNFYNNFSVLVYSFRNAIVHNKETEFHLTYATLTENQNLHIILEFFLLPSLEEISFKLISKHNTAFWYQNKEIQLYN